VLIKQIGQRSPSEERAASGRATVGLSDLISVLDVSFLGSIFDESVDRLVHHRRALIYHTWSVLTPYHIHIRTVPYRIVSSCRVVSCRRVVLCCVVLYCMCCMCIYKMILVSVFHWISWKGCIFVRINKFIYIYIEGGCIYIYIYIYIYPLLSLPYVENHPIYIYIYIYIYI